MTIDRLGPIDPVQKFQKAQGDANARRKESGDSIAFSDEARLKSELLRAQDAVRAGQDVRADRVAEVAKKLEDPNYIDNKVLGVVADRIMDVFDL